MRTPWILAMVRSGAAFGAVIALGGCIGGGGGGGGGVANIGGAPDSPCNLDYHKQGCATVATKPTKVECKDGGDGTAKWASLGECATGEYCAEEAIAGEPVTSKKTAVCKAIPAGGGGGGGGTTDGGPAKTPAQEFSCIEQQCSSQVAACMADAKCAALLACGKACADEACTDKCGEAISQDDQATFALVLGLSACGAEKDCVSVCGNGKCQAGENQSNCADDCSPKGPTCGDGKCESGETNASCPADCKAAGAVCGNGTCEAGETNASCPQDCKSTSTAVCGNGTCDSGESAATCLFDCDAATKAEIACAQQKCASQWSACSSDEKCFAAIICATGCGESDSCLQGCLTAAGGVALSKITSLQSCAGEACANVSGPVCGNESCEAGETNANCPSDCQAAGPVCGNAKCEAGESTSTCPADCKAAGPVCGNETCESGESYSNCPSDCPCTSDMQCGTGKKCVGGVCQTQGTTATCGDLVCASGENCTMDCDSAAKAAVMCAMEACADWSKCKANSGCWAAFVCANQCGSDQTCIQGCGAKAGTGLNTLLSLADCTQKTCSGGGPVCGNGSCESGETSSNCPVDCKSGGCTSNSQCPSGQSCVAGVCKASSGGCSAACPSGTSCQNGICTKFTSGSCVGACDKQSADGCYCDDACEDPSNSDCCPDKALVCTP